MTEIVQSISEMFDRIWRREISPGDVVACGHCTWTGITTKLAPHLLTCPDGYAPRQMEAL